MITMLFPCSRSKKNKCKWKNITFTVPCLVIDDLKLPRKMQCHTVQNTAPLTAHHLIDRNISYFRCLFKQHLQCHCIFYIFLSLWTGEWRKTGKCVGREGMTCSIGPPVRTEPGQPWGLSPTWLACWASLTAFFKYSPCSISMFFLPDVEKWKGSMLSDFVANLEANFTHKRRLV